MKVDNLNNVLDFIQASGFEVVYIKLKLKHKDCPKTIFALLTKGDDKVET